MTKIRGPHGDETESWVNQRQDEPLPASHHDDPDQRAVTRNEEHAAAHAGDHPARAGQPDQPHQADQANQPAQPADHEPDPDGPGKAVRDMMPSGPAPQGDVPDAPAVQVAAAEDSGDDDPKSRPGPVRLVSNAVPGRPDGEVDTRA